MRALMSATFAAAGNRRGARQAARFRLLPTEPLVPSTASALRLFPVDPTLPLITPEALAAEQARLRAEGRLP